MKTKDLFVMYAKYNRDANRAVYTLLDALSNERREEACGSYYGSLSGLARHVRGPIPAFLGLCAARLSKNEAAQKAAAPLVGLKPPAKGTLTEAQWKDLGKEFALTDDALVAFSQALSDGDLDAPVQWFSGDTVPIHYALSNLAMHNTHHRGQISQVLDEMQVEHEFSGISTAFL
jgi:uncharacterized damage-inducible protein DinB